MIRHRSAAGNSPLVADRRSGRTWWTTGEWRVLEQFRWEWLVQRGDVSAKSVSHEPSVAGEFPSVIRDARPAAALAAPAAIIDDHLLRAE
jgi:hypothetical protein